MKEESFKYQYLASWTWAVFFLMFSCKSLFDWMTVGLQILVVIGMLLPWAYMTCQYYKIDDSKHFKLCLVAALLMILAILLAFI